MSKKPIVFPLRFRKLYQDSLLFSSESGDFFVSDSDFLERYVTDALTEHDHDFLLQVGGAAERENDFYYISHLHRIASRQAVPAALAYLILVPTLRCNLCCTYCQVSRAPENAAGFDWSQATARAVLRFMDGLTADEVKIEFQGGEPLLRVDLLEEVHEFCSRRFRKAEYVVCTNLSILGEREKEFLRRPGVFVSTSLDGDECTHRRNRTKTHEQTTAFYRNLESVFDIVGQNGVSALPTIDYSNPPPVESLIESFQSLGFRSIYLRPMSYHGFARKLHKIQQPSFELWERYYFDFLREITRRNYLERSVILDEFYFTLCLHRILRYGQEFHVDLRNPNYLATGHLAIDYDGRLYPSDEARMLARIGEIDLSIGDIEVGINEEIVTKLNFASANNYHEDCIHCVYQPFCGSDVIDDIARYGRIDVPKLETWFCRRHMSIFDKAFEYIYAGGAEERFSVWNWAGLPRAEVELGERYHGTPVSQG